MLLVGDSAANTVLGHATTLPVTMEEMIPVRAWRAPPGGPVVADLPSAATSLAEQRWARRSGC